LDDERQPLKPPPALPDFIQAQAELQEGVFTPRPPSAVAPSAVAPSAGALSQNAKVGVIVVAACLAWLLLPWVLSALAQVLSAAWAGY
jgi:hypothetical protein